MNGVSMMKPLGEQMQHDEMTIEETLAAINNSTILNQFSAFDGGNTNQLPSINKLDTPERAKRLEQQDELPPPLPVRELSPKLTNSNKKSNAMQVSSPTKSAQEKLNVHFSTESANML